MVFAGIVAIHLHEPEKEQVAEPKDEETAGIPLEEPEKNQAQIEPKDKETVFPSQVSFI